jgi:hypothetical protein
VTPTINGKDWNGSVRVKKPSANLEAAEHLNLIKQDSGEKPLGRTLRRKSSSDNMNHRLGGVGQDTNSVHSTHTPGTPSSLFHPVSHHKYTPSTAAASSPRSFSSGTSRGNSRSTTPTGLRPSGISRPNSRSTTPTTAASKRRQSVGACFNNNNDDMTDISGNDSQCDGGGEQTPGRTASARASASLLSPYNLMVAAPHGRALDSEQLSDADLKSVGKQMQLLRLLLQSKSAADAECEEADILHAWQVVHSAEEQARLLAAQDSSSEEITRVHQQILDMVR